MRQLLGLKIIGLFIIFILFSGCKLKDGDAQREFKFESSSSANPDESNGGNPSPIISAKFSCDKNAMVGTAYSCLLTADVEGLENEAEAEQVEKLWELTDENTCGWLQLNPLTGEISGTPEKSNAGTCIIGYRFRVGDNSSVLNKTLISIESSPILVKATCSTQNMVEASYNCKPTIETESLDLNFSWGLTNLNSCKWLQINSETGEVSGIPLPSDVGVCTLSLLASNSENDSNRFDLKITVKAPPIFVTANCASQIEIDQSFNCQPIATTASSDKSFKWKLSADTTCKWVSVDENLGKLSGTPLMADSGNCRIGVVATNSGTSSSTTHANVKINLKGVVEHITFSSDGKGSDDFARSVAQFTGGIVVGVAKDNTSDTDTGSVSIFSYNSTNGWREVQKIVPDDANIRSAWYGHSVASSGSKIVVGAPGYVTRSGAVYVYKKSGDRWVPDTSTNGRLVGSTVSAVDEFGCSVALSGNLMVVGAKLDDARGTNAGAAYVFRFNGTDWIEEAKLFSSDIRSALEFGTSVAVSGNIVVVGAPKSNEFGTGSGSAYIFEIKNGQWTESAKIVPADNAAYSMLATSLAIYGNKLVIGAPGAKRGVIASGAAYVFTRNTDGSWYQEQKLVTPDIVSGQKLGQSVSLYGGEILLGAPGEGKTYRYKLNNSIWSLEQILLSTSADKNSLFGESVSINPEHYVVGAPKGMGMEAQSGAAIVFTKK